MDRKITPLVLFLVGVVIAAVLVRAPSTPALLSSFADLGYLTAFIGGLLYATSLTSATGTIVLANVGESSNPLLAAVIGGLGSLFYDLVIFRLVADQMEHRPVLHRLVDFFHRHRRLRWTAAVGGAMIIASPLPDELGIALLDGVGAPPRWFVPLSFGLNTLGILVIIGLF